MPPQPQLDHLILFVPPSPSNPSTPHIPPSLSKNFTLTPGGVHADGLTANTLVLLADGCYIEIICFVGPPTTSPENDEKEKEREQKIKTHWWGGSAALTPTGKEGWTDWCLTTPPTTSATQNYEHISHTTSRYDPPRAGSRLRPDGVEVKWEVTFPKGDNGGQNVRGAAPFWCHDVGERGIRVPIFDDEEGGKGVRHPSGVTGVKEFTVLVGAEGVLEDFGALYRGLFGEGEVVGEGVGFRLGRVRGVGVDGEGSGAKVLLRVARTEEEKRRCEERSFWFGDVVFAAVAEEGVEGREKGTRVRLDEEGGEADLGGLWVEYV
ncbi:hypothetical protein DM02DRAFT_729113 [Periconia macrospinosa]|uniref:Glyoxalase-like domain-containing protein n=1 Tax=Periconia macrospinosa TaxID=97972 RepID=A0A2V1DN62_9PLEO|nr:hypothetical protein DM02DRAFT_729113 [Periconia macrospinosa]